MSAAELSADQPVAGGGGSLPRLLLVGIASAALLWTAWSLYLAGEPLFAVLMLALMAGIVTVYGTARFYAGRFVFPAVVAVLGFIALPVLYTSWIGFTNYSSRNLLSFQRATEVLLSRSVVDEDSETRFGLVADGEGFRIFLPGEAGGLLSDVLALDGSAQVVAAEPVAEVPETLPMKQVVARRDALGAVSVTTPEGRELRSAGLRSFAQVEPLWSQAEDGSLLNSQDGSRLVADQEVGFYRDEAGDAVAPGWRVGVGFDNFRRIFTNEGVRGPMGGIFLWTVVFAALSTFFTFSVGVLLASILQWPHLAFRGVYRVLLILPYAVPGFISILVFRGLFNQNFGEINLILNALFGIRPEWFTDATLARTMLIIVNTWLGYPYMMLLAMGFLQGVPGDHKKAAALEGAGALRVFFTITLPQILPPFLPMLISSFAFNFNNIVLILLLTQGMPDIPGTLIPAGKTDILGSFTYRLSFVDSSQDFGLAGAIALLVFALVGLIAYANFVALRRVTGKGRA